MPGEGQAHGEDEVGGAQERRGVAVAMVNYDRTLQYIEEKYGIEKGQCPMISSVDGTIAEKL